MQKVTLQVGHAQWEWETSFRLFSHQIRRCGKAPSHPFILNWGSVFRLCAKKKNNSGPAVKSWKQNQLVEKRCSGQSYRPVTQTGRRPQVYFVYPALTSNNTKELPLLVRSHSSCLYWPCRDPFVVCSYFKWARFMQKDFLKLSCS